MKRERQQTGLTPEQIAAEEELMEGLLPINIGAFICPVIWGPAHGHIITLLYYPLWIFIDYELFFAYTNPEPMSIAFASIMIVVLIVVSLIYARLAQPLAAHRAAAKGKSKERYKREERIWAVVSIIIAIAVIAFATWYNLTIRVAG